MADRCSRPQIGRGASERRRLKRNLDTAILVGLHHERATAGRATRKRNDDLGETTRDNVRRWYDPRVYLALRKAASGPLFIVVPSGLLRMKVGTLAIELPPPPMPIAHGTWI